MCFVFEDGVKEVEEWMGEIPAHFLLLCCLFFEAGWQEAKNVRIKCALLVRLI
jgi:hypothetical protein